MGLFQALFGGGPPKPQWGYDDNGHITQDNPTQPAPAALQGQPNAQAPIEVSGGPRDQWKPEKLNFWQKLADVIAEHTDDGSPFQERANERNINSAMQGFAANPMQTIRRMGMIKGQEGTAWKMYNEQTDNVRQQGALDKQLAADRARQEELVFRRLGNMANVATPETWPQVRSQIITLGHARGIDNIEDYVPEEYSPGAAGLLAAGVYPVARQMSQKETGRHNSVVESQGQQRIGETVRHNRANEGLGQQRVGIAAGNLAESRRAHDLAHQDRQQSMTQAKPAAVKPSPTMTMVTVHGYDGTPMQVPFEVAPDKKSAVLRSPDGKPYRYINVNGKWVPTHQKPKGSK